MIVHNQSLRHIQTIRCALHHLVAPILVESIDSVLVISNDQLLKSGYLGLARALEPQDPTEIIKISRDSKEYGLSESAR